MQPNVVAVPIIGLHQGLSRAIQDFLVYAETDRGWSEQTQSAYAHDLALFERWLASTAKGGDSLVSVLSAETFAQFASAYAKDRRCGPARRWRLTAAGRSLLTFAMKRRIIAAQDLSIIERPKLPVRVPVSVTLEDARALVTAAQTAPPLTKALLLTLISTGLRVGEIASLNIADWRDHTFRVTGKGDKQRIVPVSDDAEAAISEYLPLRPMQSHPSLFQSAHGRIAVRTIQRICADASKAAGLPAIHPHQLRHTFATLLHEAGADIVEISRLLGHANVATTMIYTHSSPSRLRATTNLLPKLI
jgi:site-specific recombinase XerD